MQIARLSMQFSTFAGTAFSDLGLATRRLSKQPLFGLVAILTLAAGIGANSAIFTVVKNVLISPLPYPNSERLVMMAENDNDISNRMISYPNFVDWRERNDVFDSISTVRDLDMSLTDGGAEVVTAGGVVTAKIVAADYFKVLGLNPLAGRDFSRDDERAASHVALISQSFWREHFRGDPSILGQSISLNRVPFTIIGVMADAPHSPSNAPIWLLVGGDWGYLNWGRSHRSERSAGFVIGRLKPGVDITQARDRINLISADLFRTYPVENAGGGRVTVLSLRDALTSNLRPALLLLSAAVGLLLLIACANVASLLLARAASRRREAAILAALGASRARIIRQAVTESLALSVLGGVTGLVFAGGLITLYGSLRYPVAPAAQGLGLDKYVAGFTLSLSLLTGLVFGLVSGLYVSKPTLGVLGSDGGHTMTMGGSGSRVRNLIVTAEIAMALTLLTCAGLMINSFVRLLRSPLGFNSHSVTAIDLNLPYGRYDQRADRSRLFRQLIDQVAARPGVQSVSISSSSPGFPDQFQNDIFPEDHPRLQPGEIINVDWTPVTEGYFATTGVPILRGRTFTQKEVDDGSPVVIVDQTLAERFWPRKDALGKWIKYDSPQPHQIIGIAGPVKRFGSTLQPLIKIYTPFDRANVLHSVLLIRTAIPNPAGLTAAVADIAQRLDPDIPIVKAETMDDLLSQAAAPARFYAISMGCFAAMATLLAVCGLYALLSYLVAERTREIGIRMAIGASRRQVVTLIMTRGMKLTAVGVGIGIVASIASSRLISTALFGISATDPTTLILTALVFFAVAAAGCLAPTLRASRIDPMRALQCE